MREELHRIHAVQPRLSSAQDAANHPGDPVRECPVRRDVGLDSDEPHVLVLHARGAQRNAIIRIGLRFERIEQLARCCASVEHSEPVIDVHAVVDERPLSGTPRRLTTD
jgi:hypothetical protein